jgi:hypothetical protein
MKKQSKKTKSNPFEPKAQSMIRKSFHRNGVCGAPFYVAIITDEDGVDKLVIQFEEQGHTAVLGLDQLTRGVIEFGHNSWRGDQYETEMRNETWDLHDELEVK